MPVEVVEYSPEWPQQFEQVAAEVSHALSAIPAITTEHVGSTSVPGLTAKPILDIDIIVAREQIGAAVSALQRVG